MTILSSGVLEIIAGLMPEPCGLMVDWMKGKTKLYFLEEKENHCGKGMIPIRVQEGLLALLLFLMTATFPVSLLWGTVNYIRHIGWARNSFPLLSTKPRLDLRVCLRTLKKMDCHYFFLVHALPWVISMVIVMLQLQVMRQLVSL